MPPVDARERGAREDDASEVARDTATPSVGPLPQRILVVEDDPDLCDLLCDLLNTQGYRAEAVQDGAAAIRRVADACPDAVVLDVMLPEMDGFQVCQALKFHRETNLIPILMLTALDSAEARQRGLRVGADRYLTKPFQPDELLRQLRGTIEHRRSLETGKVRTHVRLQMQSDAQLREQLNDLLSELFQHTPLPEEEAARIRCAALEMVGNAIEWGNRKQKDLTVSISYELTDDALRFVVADEGPGFDPSHVPHAANDDDPTAHMAIREQLGLRDGGFGIMIAKGMVDRVEYNDAGNQVTLIKYLRPATPQENGRPAGEQGSATKM